MHAFTDNLDIEVDELELGTSLLCNVTASVDVEVEKSEGRVEIDSAKLLEIYVGPVTISRDVLEEHCKASAIKNIEDQADEQAYEHHRSGW